MYQLKLFRSCKKSSAVCFISAIMFFFLSSRLNAVDVKVYVLHLPVTVTDKKGEVVKGIPHNLFTVFVDKIPYQIDYLREDENIPVSLTVALNVSSSMKGKFSKVRESLKAFLSQDSLKGEVSLLTFDAESQVIQEWTENRSEVISKLDSLGTSKTEKTTRLYDVCQKSLINFKNTKGLKHKAVLIITDNGDFNSITRADDLRRLCQEQNVVIHTMTLLEAGANSGIATPGEIQSYSSTKQLEELSSFSGGTYFPIVTARELEPTFTKINSYIRNQYLIGIDEPSAYDKSKRYRLEVKVTSPTGMNKLVVRSRDYYYANSSIK
jgi:VWFA-related protein